MGQNTSANYEKSFRKQKKALKTNGFQGFDGGDKRDRTADLLNAMDFEPESHGFLCIKQQIIDKYRPNSFYYSSFGI